MLSINTNAMALNAQLALRQHTDEINRLAKILIDANGGGSASADLDKVPASVVPTYLTSTIRGTTQAMANTDKATDLMNKEKSTLDNIIEALNAMKSAAEILFEPNTWMYSPTDITNAPSKFESAKSSLSLYIASNSYNGIALSSGGVPLTFQVGQNAKDKISFELPSLTSGDLETKLSSVAGFEAIKILPDTLPTDDLNYKTLNKDSNGQYYDPNYKYFNDTEVAIQDALDGLIQANGSVTANISQLAFVKSRLQVDLDHSKDYRSTLLSDAVASINAKLAVQEMLKSVAQSMLAQANVSNQGILDLISSTRIQ